MFSRSQREVLAFAAVKNIFFNVIIFPHDADLCLKVCPVIGSYRKEVQLFYLVLHIAQTLLLLPAVAKRSIHAKSRQAFQRVARCVCGV